MSGIRDLFLEGELHGLELKIVEEPPDHLVFIFATTQSDAVPATILSRCQEFRFRRVPLDELVLYLETIAEREKISVGPSAPITERRDPTRRSQCESSACGSYGVIVGRFAKVP